MRIFRKYHVGLIVRHNLSKLIILAVPCLFIVVPLASTRLTGLGIMLSPEALLSLVFGCVFLMVLFGEMKFDIKRFAPKDHVRVIFTDHTDYSEVIQGDYLTVDQARADILFLNDPDATIGCFQIFNEYGKCLHTIGT
jgi:hypothetical protein